MATNSVMHRACEVDRRGAGATSAQGSWRRARRLVRTGLVLWAITTAASGAWASESDDALIQQALKLRRVGEDEKAVVLFRQAYQDGHTPRAAAQLGLCEQALGRWAEAERYVTEGLRGADQDAWVQKNRRTLESTLGEIKLNVARIEVVGEPGDAEVLFNGTVVGRLPLAAPVHVTAGEVQITLRAPGHGSSTKNLSAVGNQDQKIVLRLARVTPLPSSAKQSGPDARDLAAATRSGGAVGVNTATLSQEQRAPAASNELAAESSLTSESEVSPDGRSATWRGAAKWLAWGGAVLSGGVAAYGVIQNDSLVNEFDRGCGFDATTHAIRSASGTPAMDATCVSLHGRYTTAGHLGIGGLVGAGVLGALGFVLWLTEPPRPAAHPASAGRACAPVLMGREMAVGCFIRF